MPSEKTTTCHGALPSTARVEILWPRAATSSSSTGRRDGADRHAQVFQPEEAHQQQTQHPPAGGKGRAVVNGLVRRLQLREVIVRRDVLPEEPHQGGQRGGDGD